MSIGRILEREFVLASTSPVPRVWNFYPTLEAAQAAAPVVNADNAARYPGMYPDYEPMSYDAFAAAQRGHYLDKPITEVTAERWDEMLNVLPPMHWERADGVERFVMSEAIDGLFNEQYARCDDRYFSAVVNRRDRSTWLTRAKIEAWLRETAKAATA